MFLLNKVQVFLTVYILAIFVWSVWMHYWQYCMRGCDALSLSEAIWWRWCDIYGAIIRFEYLCLLMSFCHLTVMWSSQLSEPKHLGTMKILYVSQSTFVRKEITLRSNHMKGWKELVCKQDRTVHSMQNNAQMMGRIILGEQQTVVLQTKNCEKCEGSYPYHCLISAEMCELNTCS